MSDTSLLVPTETHVKLVDTFQHIQDWANVNGMVINLHKTKVIVLHRLHPSRWYLPQSLEGIKQVLSFKLLELFFRVPSVSLILVTIFLKYVGSVYSC